MDNYKKPLRRRASARELFLFHFVPGTQSKGMVVVIEIKTGGAFRSPCRRLMTKNQLLGDRLRPQSAGA
jgi:hypothetical protein